MREHLGEFRLTAMCRVLEVNPSGYYAWAGNSGRPRCREDDRLRGLIKHAWLVGWAMQSQMTTDLVLQALVSAVWKRKPAAGLIIHYDQGSQFTSSDWLSLLKQHGMVPSMSRRGNCHDNAVAESFFSALKKERIKVKTSIETQSASSR